MLASAGCAESFGPVGASDELLLFSLCLICCVCMLLLVACFRTSSACMSFFQPGLRATLFFLMLGCQGPCEKKPCSLVWFLLLFLHCFLAVLVKPEKIDWCWLVVSRAMPGGLLYSFFFFFFLSLFAHSRHGLVHYFPVLACMLIFCVP